MANWLTRIFKPSEVRASEGAYRPGPYALSDGVLSATAGKFWNFWQLGYSVQPYSGSSAIVETCVSRYAQTVAMLPGNHWKTLPSGGRERVTSSALFRILREPNDYQSISDLLLNLTTALYEHGEAFVYAVRNDRKEIAEIHHCRAGKPILAVDGSIFYWLSGNEVLEQRIDMSEPVPARDVMHIRLKTPKHPLKGVSPLLSVALDLAAQGAVMSQQISFYLNQARPSFILETAEKLTPEQMRDLRNAWNEQTQGENAGGTPILGWGLQAKPVTMSANDGKIAELLKMSEQNIAMAFGIPLQILGIGDTPFASTESLISSWKAQGLGFCLNHIEVAFDRLFGLKGQPDEYTEFDTDALLRLSFKERMEALGSAADKIYSRNEARASEGLPAREGGDELYVQQQDIPLSMSSKYHEMLIAKQLQPPAPAAEPQEVDEEDDDSRSICAITARDLIQASHDIERRVA